MNENICLFLSVGGLYGFSQQLAFFKSAGKSRSDKDMLLLVSPIHEVLCLNPVLVIVLLGRPDNEPQS